MSKMILNVKVVTVTTTLELSQLMGFCRFESASYKYLQHFASVLLSNSYCLLGLGLQGPSWGAVWFPAAIWPGVLKERIVSPGIRKGVAVPELGGKVGLREHSVEVLLFSRLIPLFNF